MKFRKGIRFTHFCLRCHSGAGRNPEWMLEHPRTYPFATGRSKSWFRLSFPLSGNGLHKALDSGLRRNDGKVAIRRPVTDAALPPASMQAGLRRNDGALTHLT